MPSVTAPKFDFVEWQARVRAQFEGLNPNRPETWPIVPQLLLFGLVAGLVVLIAWFTVLTGYGDELAAQVAKEETLRADYKKKIVQAINLDGLKKQREEVQAQVTKLERQLPSKAEMDALLSDINQAGLGRNLQFELFRPGQVLVRDYYAELPIAIRVTGRYHDIGAFTSDIARLSRIVTLNNLGVAPLTGKDGVLGMDATAKTFRYLDNDEILAQKKAGAGVKK